MKAETVSLFFALLSLVAIGLAVVSGVLLGTGSRGSVYAVIRPAAVALATAIACTATAGSLYLSEVLHYRPCMLCWVQRFFMYPAAVLLLLAMVTKKSLWAKLASLLALLGLPVALFHRYEQFMGANSALCDADNPCSVRWVDELGFITVPTMAAMAFAAMFLLLRLGTSSEHGKIES